MELLVYYGIGPIWGLLTFHWSSPVAQLVKNLPANAGNTRDVGREDSVEKEMATHSNILAWKIPWTEEPGWLQYMRLERAGQD